MEEENFVVQKARKGSANRKQPPGVDRFGGLQPFQHHDMPDEFKHQHQYAGFQQDGIGQDDHPPEKDPDVWDPPTPLKQPKSKSQPNQWGAPKASKPSG